MHFWCRRIASRTRDKDAGRFLQASRWKSCQLFGLTRLIVRPLELEIHWCLKFGWGWTILETLATGVPSDFTFEDEDEVDGKLQSSRHHCQVRFRSNYSKEQSHSEVSPSDRTIKQLPMRNQGNALHVPRSVPLLEHKPRIWPQRSIIRSHGTTYV